jgi:hypothetical protein
MATLSISFPLITPTPQAGYRIIYWPTDSPSSSVVVTPNPISSPVVITGLNATSYTGTVQVSCGGGTFSTPVTFTAAATTSGAATLSIGTPCGAGSGNYNLTGTVGDVVRLKLGVTGLLTPSDVAWLTASIGSVDPDFFAIATTECFQPGANASINLNIYKNITIPVGGVVNINTSIFANNSTSSMVSASLTIMTVNGGNNTSTGNTQINGVCVGNSSTGGSCPGVSYIGD